MGSETIRSGKHELDATPNTHLWSQILVRGPDLRVCRIAEVRSDRE